MFCHNLKCQHVFTAECQYIFANTVGKYTKLPPLNYPKPLLAASMAGGGGGGVGGNVGVGGGGDGGGGGGDGGSGLHDGQTGSVCS